MIRSSRKVVLFLHPWKNIFLALVFVCVVFVSCLKLEHRMRTHRSQGTNVSKLYLRANVVEKKITSFVNLYLDFKLKTMKYWKISLAYNNVFQTYCSEWRTKRERDETKFDKLQPASLVYSTRYVCSDLNYIWMVRLEKRRNRSTSFCSVSLPNSNILQKKTLLLVVLFLFIFLDCFSNSHTKLWYLQCYILVFLVDRESQENNKNTHQITFQLLNVCA